ncbi:hypothetical protein QFC19_006210 [Naganishia cerealis]|uniref:Uncharacterized protein n=1 Tax=Naganishia cerealis TaxID=610337 RepID=A0ACC2VHV8_9TREE|nr:hypothetical protein QFC19_006210 [Naganishia cerealis]
MEALDLPRLLSLMQNAVENSASSADISKRDSSSAEDSAQAMTSHNYEVSQTRSSAYEPANMSVPQSGIGGFVGPGGSGTSVVDYVRMVDKMGKEVLFELKGHAHFGDEHDQETSSSPEGNGGFDGGGIMGVGFANGGFGSGSSNRAMSHRRSADDPPEKSVKAFWIMGRKWCSRNDAGGRMLEHFLELKLENERLKQELKAYATASFQPSHVTQIGNFNAAGQPKERTASADNTDDSGQDDDASDDEIPGVLRQPPQNNRVSDLQLMATGEDSKKSKRQKNKNPEYLCRNCGRNDSPEWRKGPLGPKTLCNACGLRWAKKQAGPNNAKRKEKEKDKEVIGGGGSMEGFHAMGVNRMDMP